MNPYPLLLLDLDGTLVDSFADICDGVRKACEAIGVPATDDLLRFATRGVPLEDFYAHAVGAPFDAPAEAARFTRFVDAYRAHYLPGCVNTTVPYPGVPETLAAIRALARPPVIAVATTKRSETARRVLEGTGLAALIDVVCGSDGLPPKPDPAVLRRAAAEAGVAVEAALMVGDTDRDVLAARAAGCRVCAVTYGGLDAEELATFAPDHLIDAFPRLYDLVTDPAASAGRARPG